VQTAIKRFYKKRALPKPAHIEKLAAKWHPYCSTACWYLWRSLELPVVQNSNHKGHQGARSK
jgi:DNA-3-methyladenine glycosylase II